MIDYRAHLTSLTACESTLGTLALGDPGLAASREEQLEHVNKERGSAMLGALADHLLAHAASDGAELSLLGRAADLWKQGLDLYAAIGASRADIEAALADPGKPGAADKFNDGVKRFRDQVPSVQLAATAIEKLRTDIMHHAHIGEHPRQADRDLPAWGWGDIFLARRTDAMVRMVYRGARHPADHAFAFGLLSGYGANACGSAYLGQVVGGPRRTHRFRDRIARNAVGSWFASVDPGLPAPSAIAEQIRFGPSGAPALPTTLETLLSSSLLEAYDPARTPPLPDLQLGYRRLLRHLELLDSFGMPPSPELPLPAFVATLYADPANPAPPLFSVEASNYADGPGQPPPIHPTNHSGSAHTTPTESDKAPTTAERCGSFWMGVVAAITFLAGGWIPCVVAWSDGDRCIIWDEIWKNFNDANRPSQEQMDWAASQSQPLTASEFENLAKVDQMTRMVGYMFDLQNHLWEGLSKARAVLAIYGLIYPDGLLDNPAYAQFTAVPAGTTLPLQADPSQATNFHRYPPAVVENPASGWGPYPIEASPDAFVGPAGPNTPAPTACGIALQTWLQIMRGELDADNLDLDADRGIRHPCWAANGPISSDPLSVRPLPYHET